MGLTRTDSTSWVAVVDLATSDDNSPYFKLFGPNMFGIAEEGNLNKMWIIGLQWLAIKSQQFVSFKATVNFCQQLARCVVALFLFQLFANKPVILMLLLCSAPLHKTISKTKITWNRTYHVCGYLPQENHKYHMQQVL